MPFEHEKIPFGLSNSNMNDLWSLVFQKKKIFLKNKPKIHKFRMYTLTIFYGNLNGRKSYLKRLLLLESLVYWQYS